MNILSTKGNNEKESDGKCLLCGGALSSNSFIAFDVRFGIEGGHDICKCLICGLAQIFPVPFPNILKNFYEKYYNFGGEEGTIYTYLRTQLFKSKFYRFWLEVDGDISFHKMKGTGMLLDIGCNEGRGLQIYKDNGFNAEGLELNELSAIEARKSGFVVYTDSIETIQLNGQYDIVVLSNVLEHSLSPKEMLNNVNRILKPGGQVWISCPNARSWQCLIFRKYWINWHVPFHIVHFSRKILEQTISQAKFDLILSKQVTPALWVAQSVIAFLFSKPGVPTRQLRNSFIVAFLMLLIRGLAFPILWLGNRLGRGDCLVVVGQKEFN